MTRPRQVLVPAFNFVLIFVLGISLTGRASSAQERKGRRRAHTAAANVTMRDLPLPRPSAQLPLGTEVTDAGPAGLDKVGSRKAGQQLRSGSWRVANRSTRRGAGRPSIASSPAVGRKGDGFSKPRAGRLHRRVAPEYTDPDGRARIDLDRLRAMSAALAAIPSNGLKRDPYASWLKAHEADVIGNEVAGTWMLSNSKIWDLYRRHERTTSADDLAWLAVTNGLPGECEGFLPCYVEWRNRLQGEYLRRQPAGRHAEEAVGAIKQLADLLARAPPAERSLVRSRATADHGVGGRARPAVKAPAPDRDAALAKPRRKICQ
jgi:hypothetical protein